MMFSMTGYGAAEHAENGVSYALELRSVNHRYLKLHIKLPENLQFLEPALEKQVRGRMARGSVLYALRVRREEDPGVRSLNLAALQAYMERLGAATVPQGVQATVDLATLATLPGVCEQPDLDDQQRDERRRIVTELTSRALDDLTAMRRQEGEALLRDLAGICEAIRKELGRIGERSPGVVDEYHERLRNRVAVLTSAAKLELDGDALAREVALYADRSDISEEITRINSHLDQFAEISGRGEPVGRTLDFLTQELLREANTIASKSNDAAIARSVVEIKSLIDRLKEQVQNVE